MARLRKQQNYDVANRAIAVGSKVIWDNINKSDHDWEDFVAFLEGGDIVGGIAKKVPFRTDNKHANVGSAMRYDKQMDSDTTGNYITLVGADSDIVEFLNVKEKGQTEVGEGSFSAGTIVYGKKDTNGIVTIESSSSSGAIVIGTVEKALFEWNNEAGQQNKSVWVRLKMNGSRFETVA